ncbi:MAG: acetyl-CoA decarbonylase/synthase complex subunit gamma [Pseudomonadota bacterium]
MALTGIEIFKKLPKTNCGECGVPTCLAFAMNLAAGKAELAACPHVSEAIRTELSEASAPPIRTVQIGVDKLRCQLGGETVLFRHEKTFVSPPPFAAQLADTLAEGEIDERIERWSGYSYERVGVCLRPEMVAVCRESGDPVRFGAAVARVVAKDCFAIMLVAEDVPCAEAGLKAAAGKRPLLHAATEANAEDFARLAKEYGAALAVSAADLDGLMALTEKLVRLGVKDLVLDAGNETIAATLRDQVAIRRSALAKVRALGYPTVVFASRFAETGGDPLKEALAASVFVAKYGGLVVLSDFRGETIFPLLLQRLNIFSDPQRPMTVTQGIYEIGGPKEDSPVMITTNFSLTYFILSGEVESSRVPTWLLIMDADGLSVLTAWAAGKFVGDLAGTFVKKSGIEDKVSHRNIIIPGYAAAIVGDMEDALPGWKIDVGPREASHVPAYLRQWKPS